MAAKSVLLRLGHDDLLPVLYTELTNKLRIYLYLSMYQVLSLFSMHTAKQWFYILVGTEQFREIKVKE